jgi:hypothetical protein
MSHRLKAAVGLSASLSVMVVVGDPQSGTYCESAFQDGVSIGKACIPHPYP